MPNLCQTNTQLPLVGLEAAPSPQPSLKPLEGMAVSAEDRPKFDKKAYLEKWRQEHPERLKEHSKRYRLKNAEHIGKEQHA